MAEGGDRSGDLVAPRLRVFTDDEGVQWEVTEVSGARVPAARGARCLIFSSVVAIRRVWRYPDSWHRLSGAELIDLSWSR